MQKGPLRGFKHYIYIWVNLSVVLKDKAGIKLSICFTLTAPIPPHLSYTGTVFSLQTHSTQRPTTSTLFSVSHSTL